MRAGVRHEIKKVPHEIKNDEQQTVARAHGLPFAPSAGTPA